MNFKKSYLCIYKKKRKIINYFININLISDFFFYFFIRLSHILQHQPRLPLMLPEKKSVYDSPGSVLTGNVFRNLLIPVLTGTQTHTYRKAHQNQLLHLPSSFSCSRDTHTHTFTQQNTQAHTQTQTNWLVPKHPHHSHLHLFRNPNLLQWKIPVFVSQKTIWRAFNSKHTLSNQYLSLCLSIDNRIE